MGNSVTLYSLNDVFLIYTVTYCVILKEIARTIFFTIISVLYLLKSLILIIYINIGKFDLRL
jgi:hypothetical protein